jgi:hypothetical protein
VCSPRADSSRRVCASSGRYVNGPHAVRPASGIRSSAAVVGVRAVGTSHTRLSLRILRGLCRTVRSNSTGCEVQARYREVLGNAHGRAKWGCARGTPEYAVIAQCAGTRAPAHQFSSHLSWQLGATSGTCRAYFGRQVGDGKARERRGPASTAGGSTASGVHPHPVGALVPFPPVVTNRQDKWHLSCLFPVTSRMRASLRTACAGVPCRGYGAARRGESAAERVSGGASQRRSVLPAAEALSPRPVARQVVRGGVAGTPGDAMIRVPMRPSRPGTSRRADAA